MTSLPSKRSPASSPEGITSPKKTKAEKKRESIARAKEWATERKRKKEGAADDDPKKHKAEEGDTEDVVAGEEMDVLEGLSSPLSTRSRRSNKTDDISESSIGSRRSTRRRTMTSNAASATSTPSTRSKASTRKSRKSEPPVQTKAVLAEEEEKLTNVEEKVAQEVGDVAEDDVNTPTRSRGRPRKESSTTPRTKTPIAAKSKEEDETAEKSTEIAAKSKEEDETAEKSTEEAVKETKAAQSGANNWSIRSLVPSFAVFLHTILLQWSIAFAVVLVFFLDWFVFEFHPHGSNAEYSDQRTSCAILGLWLVTIASYTIVLGSQSMAGWILATASLAMAKFAAEMNWEATDHHAVLLPSLPIYSPLSVDISVLDAIITVCFAGWIALIFAPNPQHHEDQDDNEDKMTSTVNAEKPKELVDAEKPKELVVVKREKSGPRSFIGDRVAVDKAGVTYHGTVAEYDPDERIWLVKYEVGEGLEDDNLNRLDMASAFRLYSKDLGDKLKAMWRANEI